MFKLSKFFVLLSSQSGVAPIFVVLLLVAGIIGGTLLVQQQTNLIPFAATDVCGGNGGSGDESKCTKFTITGCKPAANKDTCDVKFEWTVAKDSKGTADENIDLRVTRNKPAPEEVVYTRTKTVSGKTLNLKAGEYNAVISHSNGGDDINNKDKLPFSVGGDKTTFTWGSYSGSSTTKTDDSKKTDDAKKTETASTIKAKDNVKPLEGNFPSGGAGDFVPKAEKQELLNKYINGTIAGTIECRNSHAQGNQGTSTGGDEKNASSLWVVPDKPTGDIKAQYIVDCSRTAIGSYKNWEKLKCGKLKSGSSFKYGCIDTSLSNASTDKDSSTDKKNDPKSSAKATDAPTLTEKQIKDCGFSVTESGVPVFAVQVGGHTTDADKTTCEDLKKAQLSHFEGILRKARQEAEEARKNGNEAAAKAIEEKVAAAEKKTAECKDKKDKEFADCAKGAADPIKSVATAAQTQAISNALKKLEQIMKKGKPGGCVKADLGITPFLEAQRLKRRGSTDDPNPENDEARRLLLCQGDKENNLTWRVLVGGSANTGGDGDADKGNDAERIYGLHGTTANATGAPKYPYTVPGKNSFTIEDPNVEGGVLKVLGKYIEAAKAGKTTMRGPAVPGDNGSEQKGSEKKPDSPATPAGNTTFTKLNPSVAKEDAKPVLKFSQESGKKYTCAESSDSKQKYVIVKVETDGKLAKKIEVICDNGADRKYICASKSGDKELGCYNQSDLK